MNLFEEKFDMSPIDNMNDEEFISFCACFLEKIGFFDIEPYDERGSSIISLLASNGVKNAFCCVHSDDDIDVAFVRNVFAAKQIFNFDYIYILTNANIQPEARDIANQRNIRILCRRQLHDRVLACGGPKVFGLYPEKKIKPMTRKEKLLHTWSIIKDPKYNSKPAIISFGASIFLLIVVISFVASYVLGFSEESLGMAIFGSAFLLLGSIGFFGFFVYAKLRPDRMKYGKSHSLDSDYHHEN